jgi:hypothetical protein
MFGLENRSQVLANLSRRCVSGWYSTNLWVLEVSEKWDVFTVDWLCVGIVFSHPCSTHRRICIKTRKVEAASKRRNKRTVQISNTSVGPVQRLRFQGLGLVEAMTL